MFEQLNLLRIIRCDRLSGSFSHLRSRLSSCVSRMISEELIVSRSLKDRSRCRMVDGRAGGVDRKPRWEQLADRSTSEQEQTSGGHNSSFFETPATTEFVSLLAASPDADTWWWSSEDRRRRRRKKRKGECEPFRAKSCPGLTQFMALVKSLSSFHFFYLVLLLKVCLSWFIF